MQNEKARQRHELIVEFGILIQPLEDLVRRSDPPTLSDYRKALAKVRGGDPQWRKRAKRFTIFADDVAFDKEFQDLSHVPERFWGTIYPLLEDPNYAGDLARLKSEFERELEKAKSRFYESIQFIPVDWKPVVFPANTPFTAYLRIREAIVVANERLHYFDRYLKPAFFQLFLTDIDEGVSIRLVTTKGTKDYGVSGVMAVSDLARQQFPDYALIEVQPERMHDRNLRVDDQVFTLGPGVDRAGIALTNFGPAENSDSVHAELDRLIVDGRVIH